MQITLEKKKDNLASVTVETEAGRGKEAYKKTVRKFSEHINIPGFRKGKAPIKIVEAQIGVERLRAETINDLLAELLYEAFEKEDLDVISIPTIEKVEFDDPEKPIKIQATIELVPDIKLGKYKGISATVDVTKFEEDDYVEKTLERIAQQFASFEESNDKAELKDEVTFDFEGTIKKTHEKLETLKAQGFQTILDPQRFVPNFVEQIVGMKAEDEKDIEVTFPADYHEEKLCNEEVIFKIKVHKVSKMKLPEMNDEFAKKVQCDNLQDLKKRIVDEMNKVQEYNEKNASKDVLISLVVADSDVEIPESMIKREMDGMLQDLRHRVETTGRSWSDFEKTIDHKAEEKIAVERIKRSLILSAIIKKEKLQIGQEDMNAAVQSLKAYGQKVNPELLSNIRMELLTEKAIELIRENAKIKFNYLKDGEEHVHGEHCSHGHDHHHVHDENCDHDHSDKKAKSKTTKKPASKAKAPKKKSSK